jgi:hypothetical protein
MRQQGNHAILLDIGHEDIYIGMVYGDRDTFLIWLFDCHDEWSYRLDHLDLPHKFGPLSDVFF